MPSHDGGGVRALLAALVLALVGCALAGCGSIASAARHVAAATSPKRHTRRLERHPLHVSSGRELRRHPRAVVELRGTGARLHRPAAHPAQVAEDAVTGVRTRLRIVALSFDDGPDPLYTPKVLALLRVYGAHATFFAIGKRALAWPSLIRSELVAGDEVGEHTFDHPHLPALTGRGIRLELSAGTRAIAAAGAPVPSLFRPPYGQFDARVAAAAVRLHQRILLWSLNLERLAHIESPVRAVRTILRRVRPGDIILGHDGVPPRVAALAVRFDHGARRMVTNRQVSRQATLTALPALLDGLRRRGYQVVTVSTLLRAGQPIQQGLDAIDDPWQYRLTTASARRALPGRAARRPATPRPGRTTRTHVP